MEIYEEKKDSEILGRFTQMKDSIVKMFTDLENSVITSNSELAVFVKQVLAAKDLIVFEEDDLTVPILAKAIKENKVANSNQVVLYKKAKENCFVVSFSYAKDKNLLPEDENKHVAFISKTLDEAINKMFGDKDLIVIR